MLTYLLAVLAAGANATSSVLQRKANREVPQQENLSLRLIWSLLHRPTWFGGVAAVTVGFLLQAAALGNGQLAVVEPILVLELPFTLILAARVLRAGLRLREWGSALAMTVGLAGLLYFLSPSAGQPTGIRWYYWLAGIGINLAIVGGLVLWGRQGPAGSKNGAAKNPAAKDRAANNRAAKNGAGKAGGTGGVGSNARQAAVLGVAAGSAFGLTAALMKGMTDTYSQGLTTLLTSWQLYAMVAAGGLSMFLVQSAMNAGRLLAAQPGLTLADPVTSVVWGVVVFQEKVRGGWYLVLAAVSALVIAAGVLTLARSPLLTGRAAQAEEDVSAAAGKQHG